MVIYIKLIALHSLYPHLCLLLYIATGRGSHLCLFVKGFIIFFSKKLLH